MVSVGETQIDSLISTRRIRRNNRPGEDAERRAFGRVVDDAFVAASIIIIIIIIIFFIVGPPVRVAY